MFGTLFAVLQRQKKIIFTDKIAQNYHFMIIFAEN